MMTYNNDSIAFSFGMHHDNQELNHCDEKVGNVMAPAKTIRPESYDWSDCSLMDFQNFIL